MDVFEALAYLDDLGDVSFSDDDEDVEQYDVVIIPPREDAGFTDED